MCVYPKRFSKLGAKIKNIDILKNMCNGFNKCEKLEVKIPTILKLSDECARKPLFYSFFLSS